VDSYVRHALSASVVGVFGEFQRGFFQVCERTLVKLFLPEQLRGALVGQDVYDWPKLKQVKPVPISNVLVINRQSGGTNLFFPPCYFN